MDFDGDFVGDYEVFLSFRGKDTRQGFTDVLYKYMTSAGIRVFRDDDELAIGDKIDSILEAINSSKICIPVFSPNFAESKWCLREVTRMVELKKMIVPIFYKVSPDDVKLKEKSVYADDFKKFELKNYGDHVEINNWKKSLRKAASNKGRELGYKSYTQFCKELVNEVLSKLGPRRSLEIDHFVGDANKAAAMRLLDMAGSSSSQEVIYLGIHGMGGVGKTTLTKLIYNESSSKFEYCAFLPDIREFSVNKGIDDLPTYLYKHLQPKPLTEISQSGQISNLFRNKKVLLILDDVNSDEQIRKIAREPSWFGSGSKIISTSRDTKVFKDFKSASGCDIKYLEMKELEHDWSLELFSRCAFGNTSPPSSFRDLSKDVVDYVGGLPLAITVIAKYLRDQKEMVWKEVTNKLKKSSLKEVKTSLLISYEPLEDEQKEIFLDIACSFVRFSFTDSSLVDSMWEACELYPAGSLGVLQSRSLVKIVKYGFGEGFAIRMHDQLRDLGRDIVRDKSGGNIMKQSRLWKHNQVKELCKENEKNMIEVLNLDNFNDRMVFRDEGLVSFDKLRSLAVWKLVGDFSNLFTKLKYLECRNISEARNLAPPNLVILKLEESDVDENCDVWSQIPKLKKLKSLDLSRCERLRTTPVFPENRPLERLYLSVCRRLEYIDPSIGKLQHLTKLDLGGCWKLKNLPESCGELHALQELNLYGTNISLPDCIGRLMKLETLDLRSNHQQMNLTKLPSSLKVLHIICCGLTNVPDLSNLQDLTSLEIDGARFNTLGSNGSTSCKLQDLNIRMSRLLVLTLRRCEVIANILDVGEMQSLTSLTIEYCESLVSLVNLDKLKQLRKLNLIGCPSLSQIRGLGKLQGLSELTIISCDSLELKDDITGLDGLIELKLHSCPKLTKITGLVNLKSLRMLSVYGCQSTEILEVASQLEKLHGVEVRGLPDRYMDNIDGVSEPGESSSAILDLNNPSLQSTHSSSSIEQIELATNQTLSGEIEGNSCDNDMQRHDNLGAGLATHQCELEDVPPSKTKRNWCCWKLAVQDTSMQPK